jgi:hypothetical protein
LSSDPHAKNAAAPATVAPTASSRQFNVIFDLHA